MTPHHRDDTELKANQFLQWAAYEWLMKAFNGASAPVSSSDRVLREA